MHQHDQRSARRRSARRSSTRRTIRRAGAGLAIGLLATAAVTVPATARSDSVQPSLVQPIAVQSVPAQSVPAQSVSVQSVSVQHASSQPSSAQPASTESVSVQPASVQSVSTQPVSAASCRLPAAVDGLGSGFPVDEQALPAVGTLKAALLFVDFEDHPAADGSLDEAEANLASGVEYLERVSGGRLDVTTTTSDGWVRMPEPSTAYPFERGLTYEDHVRYIGDAIAAADETFDFSDVDVVWVTATKEAPNITYSPRRTSWTSPPTATTSRMP